jgi:hypothetical protein
MRGIQDNLGRAILAAIAVMLFDVEVHAQNSTTAGASAASAPAVLPIPFPVYAGNTAGLSPTDAAALGSSGGGSGAQMSNMFNNPMAAPFIYGSMFPMQSGTSSTNGGGLGGMATNQLGLMMMMNQQNGGIGSGQLSGVRPGQKGLSGPRNTKSAGAQAPRSMSQPAGLAAHYFSRTTISTPRPRVFYNRPSSHYPQPGY